MSWAELVAAAEAVRVDAAARGPRIGAEPLAAIGWATVDHERAQRELDGLLGRDPAAPSLEAWAAVDRDPALGAAVWQRVPSADVGAPPAVPSLMLLEPDTEGRLAAFLARFGEGIGVIYLGKGSVPNGEILRGGQPWGPHVVMLSSPR